MAQFLRPDGDVSQSGSWVNDASGSVLWDRIDEVFAVDTDYAWDNNVSGLEFFEVGLSDPSSPGSGSHIIRWRSSRLDGNKTAEVTAELRQGTTVIASSSRTLDSATWTTATYALTDGEVSIITNYNDLRIRFVVTSVTGSGAPPDPAISWVEFEVPDADGNSSSSSSLQFSSSTSIGAKTLSALRYRFQGYQIPLIQLDSTGPAYVQIGVHPYYKSQPEFWQKPYYHGHPGGSKPFGGETMTSGNKGTLYPFLSLDEDI